MSDDEDYYDEYDEIFWIEEPEPEIAVCETPLTLNSLPPMSNQIQTSPIRTPIRN